MIGSILVGVGIGALLCFALFFFYYKKHVKEHAEAKLSEWKSNEERRIRDDAVSRSTKVQWGKLIEHFVPFTEPFPVDPKDVVFFGKPIDFIGFTDKRSQDKCGVHFIEVKSGGSQLSQTQENIKRAITEGRVYWHEVTISGIDSKK